MEDILARRYPPAWTNFAQPRYLPDKWTYAKAEERRFRDFEEVWQAWNEADTINNEEDDSSDHMPPESAHHFVHSAS